MKKQARNRTKVVKKASRKAVKKIARKVAKSGSALEKRVRTIEDIEEIASSRRDTAIAWTGVGIAYP